MKRMDQLIAEIKRQLFPYSHLHDVDRSCERWDVGDADCLTSWVAAQLRNCRKKNKCEKRRLCVYYTHGDLAERNFRICREIVLLLENGDLDCHPKEKENP